MELEDHHLLRRIPMLRTLDCYTVIKNTQIIMRLQSSFYENSVSFVLSKKKGEIRF